MQQLASLPGFPQANEDAPSDFYPSPCRSAAPLALCSSYPFKCATAGELPFIFLVLSAWLGRLSGSGGFVTLLAKSTVFLLRNCAKSEIPHRGNGMICRGALRRAAQ